MSALRMVVQRHTAMPAHAGDAQEDRLDRAVLQKELTRVRRSREIGFWIMFLLLVLLFLGAGMAVIAYRSDPAMLGRLSTATGVTVMGVVAAMTRLWSQKTKTDLVIAIVMATPEKTAQGVLTTLLPHL